jgi:hypothetical protein
MAGPSETSYDVISAVRSNKKNRHAAHQNPPSTVGDGIIGFPHVGQLQLPR